MISHVQICPGCLSYFHCDNVEVVLSGHSWQYKTFSILSYQLVGLKTDHCKMHQFLGIHKPKTINNMTGLKENRVRLLQSGKASQFFLHPTGIMQQCMVSLKL